MKSLSTVLALQGLLLFYSLGSVLSKLAAGVDPVSWEFLFMYAGIILILGVYAIGWQQILKRLPLTSAYANKAVTVVWGIIWGFLIFNEPLTLGRAIGAVVVMAGIVLFAYSDHGNPGIENAIDCEISKNKEAV